MSIVVFSQQLKKKTTLNNASCLSYRLHACLFMNKHIELKFICLFVKLLFFLFGLDYIYIYILISFLLFLRHTLCAHINIAHPIIHMCLYIDESICSKHQTFPRFSYHFHTFIMAIFQLTTYIIDLQLTTIFNNRLLLFFFSFWHDTISYFLFVV